MAIALQGQDLTIPAWISQSAAYSTAAAAKRSSDTTGTALRGKVQRQRGGPARGSGSAHKVKDISVESAVLATQTIQTNHAIVTAIKKEGTRYHGMTSGQSGHARGPPGPFLIVRAAAAAFTAATTPGTKEIFKQFVENFCTPRIYTLTDEIVLTHLADQQTRGTGRTIEAIVENSTKRR